MPSPPRRDRSSPICCLLLLGLALCAARSARAIEVVWVYPPPNSLITESPVVVLGYVRGLPQVRLEAKVVSADGSAAPQRENLYLFKGKLFSGSLPLEPGRNNVVVGESVLPLLYRPGFEGDRDGEFRVPRAHGVGLENCSPCHGFARGELTLKKKPEQLCRDCHEVGTESLRGVTKANVHTRDVTPDCLRCHDPHVSFEAALMRSAESPCVPCHAEKSKESALACHPVEGTQRCTPCHDPHSSSYPSLLKGEPLALCRTCHKDVADPDRYPRSYHRPVEDGACFDCHRPHNVQNRGYLRQPVPVLCRPYHKEEDARAHRGKLEEGRACHTPHLSKRKNLLVDDVSAVCVNCHGDFPQGVSNHPAMREGCVTCHDPHAKVRGAVESEKVCGRCHRLSDERFHRTHGELDMPKVSQCTFCHEPHVSEYPTLLRGVVHYPLQKGGCQTCHNQGLDALPLKYEGSKNCLRCHGQITGTSTVVEIDKVHKPVTQVDCIACHNPHLGERDNFLLEEPEILCGWCHGILLRGVDKLHGIFKDGGTCYSCHLPHISDFRPLLKSPEIELCTPCHVGVLPEDLAERRLVHGAVDQGQCSGCHNPHGTNSEILLNDAPDALCAGCHQGVMRDAQGAPLTFLHGPVGAGNCTACHVLGHRHLQRDDRFLRERGSRICGLCHSTPERHVPQRYRSKMREVRNDCMACHDPHGAGNPFLMKPAL